MRLHGLISLIVLAVATRPLPAQQKFDATPYLISDRSAEVALARSAAPPSVSDSAAVLVLTPSGYVEAASGHDGFTCLVVRSFAGALEDPQFWNPDVRAPHCFNAPASRTVLQAMLSQSAWILAGVPKSEIAARAKRAYASGALHAPATGAMAYMLSPRQYIVPQNPHWLPHLMLYFDRRSISASMLGADAAGRSGIIDGSSVNPDDPVLILMVPVRRWSDGTPATPAR